MVAPKEWTATKVPFTFWVPELCKTISIQLRILESQNCRRQKEPLAWRIFAYFPKSTYTYEIHKASSPIFPWAEATKMVSPISLCEASVGLDQLQRALVLALIWMINKFFSCFFTMVYNQDLLAQHGHESCHFQFAECQVISYPVLYIRIEITVFVK